ncbi:hypothetical protein NM208_g4615 [Fusarium decemcellulare]|uniref:Uncharacterized protein n=2 Tax=Fusarium decemcellulare TaxID=57161 RepID=A0ACC1SJY7_9HYPO|nr:hypothetical protein NM208_g4676 [Fusarium decemcellulare]KAJ3541432.1 hypothetical protein NM208_g4615 [Fusarium decemcellulare]
MATYQTFPSRLEAIAAENPSVSAFKVAYNGPEGVYWKDISYAALQKDVESCARYWANELSKKGIKPRSVVGIWSKGTSYEDLVHMWAVSRAGFIPQLLSLRMTDPTVIYELLSQAQATALIYDVVVAKAVINAPLPVLPLAYVSILAGLDRLPLPPLWTSSDADQTLIIYHTSGSTSGMPKLVPITFRWFDKMIRNSRIAPYMRWASSKQHISCSAGSFNHMGSTLLIAESLERVGCFVIPTTIPYSNSELHGMIDKCGLTRLNMFPAFLSVLLREAQQDPALLKALKRLDSFLYGGGSLDSAIEEWASSQGLRIIKFFGSTEMGTVLTSTGLPGEPHLEPLPGCKVEFIPVEGMSEGQEQLLELVVPPEAAECPHPSLRNSKDGKFHTGDFFIEVAPGKYASKGRNDDWIKMQTALRCDTSAIEANAMETCGQDLISTVVVVGSARPRPAMVVELKEDSLLGFNDPAEGLRVSTEILSRIAPFHKRRYTHERIDDARLILLVPRGALPRTATKGNVRRRAVEDTFKEELDKIYASLA